MRHFQTTIILLLKEAWIIHKIQHSGGISKKRDSKRWNDGNQSGKTVLTVIDQVKHRNSGIVFSYYYDVVRVISFWTNEKQVSKILINSLEAQGREEDRMKRRRQDILRERVKLGASFFEPLIMVVNYIR